MSHDDFDRVSRRRWDAAIDSLLPARADHAEWLSAQSIVGALQPILGRNNNHAMWPAGGGNDIAAVRFSPAETGCLELQVADGSTHIVRPRRLIVQRVPEAPGDSFALLELNDLAPTDVYDDEPDEDDAEASSRRSRVVERGQEEVVELEPGQYVEAEVWSGGYVGYDEDGYEIPLPDEARRVIRWLRGKILFVAKASAWNRHTPTYDGRHNRMTVDQIRSVIERSLIAAE